jgi:hypothetical protein
LNEAVLGLSNSTNSFSVPNPGGLKQKQCIVFILEDIRLKSRSQQGYFPSQGSREETSFLPTSGDPKLIVA